ncbi:nuclear receptor-binding protein-like isoform X2 [Varroa destructor]|uniref:Nuclear receptor-binding protein homolog n=1 Tax=Varroa destructor TaxID=109461 RepID=A0A7M7MBK7_VARDE|nr:nuclear receptor-binding protein-like isoform X2 [Varroa destructor]
MATEEKKDAEERRVSGDDSEDESEVLEESPCGRWHKRREEVQQRDIPGIDAAYLAMDTEEGVEVVWNEVNFSERKNFKAMEEKIKLTFDSLAQLSHPNIVKIHNYWIDDHKEGPPRVIFITEYMSSGSVKQFLKRTKRNAIKVTLNSWKRWCRQILSALYYLHSCHPPILHGNLTCDTIFIQHNGLIKIGSVAPDAINMHVKTVRTTQHLDNVHFVAPEYAAKTVFSLITPAADVYSFGMCALEMAALEIQNNGTSEIITDEAIQKTIEQLENDQQRDLIKRCLNKLPRLRPTTRELLFHPVLFEIYSLQVLSAHAIVQSSWYQPDQLTDKAMHLRCSQVDVVAEITHEDGREGVAIKKKQVPALELEKLLEDVRNGIYPLTAFGRGPNPVSRGFGVRPRTPEVLESKTSPSPAGYDPETRHIVNIMCTIKQEEEVIPTPSAAGAVPVPTAQPSHSMVLTLLLRFDDKMNRQLSTNLTTPDEVQTLTQDLVQLGFINKEDWSMVDQVLMDTMKRYLKKQLMVLSPEDAVEPLEIQSVMGSQNHHEGAIMHLA